MGNENSLSKKKITQQSISISPLLKEKIENYVSEYNKKNPKDKRFKSVSAFYNYVMERAMESFSKGKTLNDFDQFVDVEVQGFFDKISFKAMIPYYENALKKNRYTNLTLDDTPRFFLSLWKLYKGMMDPHDFKSIKSIFNRVGNYLLANNLTKEYNLDIFTVKGSKDLKGIFEYVGIYRNLFFEFCKYSAAFFGLLGVKLSNFLITEKDLYFRFDLETTDLFFIDDLSKRERIKLMDQNLSHIINYTRIVNDDDYHLWMKIAEDKNSFISFKNKKTHEDWINLIYEDNKKFGNDETLVLYILKYYERLHWIEIQNEEDLIFQFRLPKSEKMMERELVLSTLSNYSQISKENEAFQLKELK